LNFTLKEKLLFVQTLFPKDLKLLEKIKTEVLESKEDFDIKDPLKEERVKIFAKEEYGKLKELLKANSINTLLITDDSYPENLKNIYAPPLVLFYKGDISVLKETLISIVGTRKPSSYGIKQATFFSDYLSKRGFVIISGMASGIDTYAHKGALSGGKTVAVLGSSLTKVYPARNKKLFKEIIESGCVISEFSPLSITHPSNFPIRNRIIAGLSMFTLVIEAKERSGSLITAMLALEEGRDVGAIPGNIDSENSLGTNALIKNGAYLILSPDDILELPYYKGKVEYEEEEIMLSDNERKVLSLIPKGRMINIDEIIEKAELNYGELFNILLHLRFKNLIVEFSGKNYQRSN